MKNSADQGWCYPQRPKAEVDKETFNSRKGQRTNQKYRDLVGYDQQMQRLEETELRKADRTVGVNCIYITVHPNRTVNLSEFSFYI